MDSAASEKSIIALDGWLQTPAGLYVRAWEQQCLDSLTVDIFGFNAVQIGLPQLDALAANRMPNKWLLDARLPPAPPQDSRLTLVSAFDELPFDSQSLDLVVLPHVLEFAAEPHQVLREVERVLIPEGRVIVCGFNPASLWGVRQGLGRVTGTPLPAAGGRADLYAAHERLVKIAEHGRQPKPLRLLRTCLPDRKMAAPQRFHGQGRCALVAISGRSVYSAGDQARQRDAFDRSGVDQETGDGARRRTGHE